MLLCLAVFSLHHSFTPYPDLLAIFSSCNDVTAFLLAGSQQQHLKSTTERQELPPPGRARGPAGPSESSFSFLMPVSPPVLALRPLASKSPAEPTFTQLLPEALSWKWHHLQLLPSAFGQC